MKYDYAYEKMFNTMLHLTTASGPLSTRLDEAREQFMMADASGLPEQVRTPYEELKARWLSVDTIEALSETELNDLAESILHIFVVVHEANIRAAIG